MSTKISAIMLELGDHAEESESAASPRKLSASTPHGGRQVVEESFGDILRTLRRNSRDALYGGQLSQNRLADLLSEETGMVYSRAAISDWERGKGHVVNPDVRCYALEAKCRQQAVGILYCLLTG